MSIRILAILSVLLLFGGCTSQRSSAGNDWQRIQDSGSIRIGIKSNARPFSQRVGNGFVGFDADLALALAHALGVEKVRFVPVTPTNRFEMLTSGNIDLLIGSTTITRGREERVDFSIPYFQDGQGLMVRADSPIDSYADLDGRTVGAIKGSTSAANIQQVAPGAEVRTVEDPSALPTMLLSKSLDAVTRDMLLLQKWVLEYPGKFRIAGGRFSTEPYGVAMQENQSDLRDAVNNALQELWEEGSWQAIYDTWFGPGTPYATQIRFGITPYPR